MQAADKPVVLIWLHSKMGHVLASLPNIMILHVQPAPVHHLIYDCHSHGCRFAHIQDMDRGSTTLVFTFYNGMRLQSRAAMGVAISRLIEERVGLAEGMEDVRKWLIIISAPLSACMDYCMSAALIKAAVM